VLKRDAHEHDASPQLAETSSRNDKVGHAST
jgi:hypothetical protein